MNPRSVPDLCPKRRLRGRVLPARLAKRAVELPIPRARARVARRRRPRRSRTAARWSGPGSDDAPFDPQLAGEAPPALGYRPLTGGLPAAGPGAADMMRWQALGRGRIGVVTVADSWQLPLAGRADLHGELWSAGPPHWPVRPARPWLASAARRGSASAWRCATGARRARGGARWPRDPPVPDPAADGCAGLWRARPAGTASTAATCCGCVASTMRPACRRPRCRPGPDGSRAPAPARRRRRPVRCLPSSGSSPACWSPRCCGRCTACGAARRRRSHRLSAPPALRTRPVHRSVTGLRRP